ncbi:MAG: N-acetylmuramoyl-L-alanine amidase [Gemmatimonadetes bacterium]|nr:N-acetylmuramoyl-L-alanine amidase [Gemmatimonadota bacterium]
MLLLLLSLLAADPAPAPTSVVIVTPAGERRVAVTLEPLIGPLLPAGPVLSALGGTSASDGVWATVMIGPAPFRFLLGAPVFSLGGRLYPLAAPALVRRDTLFLPLQFVSEALPRHQGTRFRWDAGSSRLMDAGGPPAVVAVTPPGTPAAPGGLRRTHRVTIDPGHGGVDPGNPGLYFPRGIREKDINLQVSLLLRDELRRRGVEVTMTRTRDTLIDLRHRGRFCADQCELFVSLHVNSLPRRSGYTAVRGFETYFLAEARTEEAARVARMENEAVRFDQSPGDADGAGGLDFILKDLQLNEYLRESARAAELVQEQVKKVHDGGDRGVKQAGFMVLTTARRPAILFEMGYSTNRADARVLSEPESQRRLARSLADAVMAYLAEYERKTAVVESPTERVRRRD